MAKRFWYPSRSDVEVVANRLAARLFAEYEGRPAGSFFLAGTLRDEGLLDSALALPQQEYYRTTTDKAGVLLRSIVKNHPYVDGNKRMGLATTFIFLVHNGYAFVPPSNEEMVTFALKLAASEPDMSWQEVARWIRQNSNSISRPFKPGLSLPVPQGIEGMARLKQWLEHLRTALDDLKQLPSS